MDEVESDFSALHNVSDVRELTAQRFFAFAKHLIAYQGALRMQAEKEQEEQEHASGAAFRKKRGQEVDRVYDDITHNPLAAELFG